MEQPPLPQLPPVSVSFEGGVLRATDFGDLYYSAEDGLAESRHVFLEGTALPASLSEARHLTIAETGFGTGLNLLALCQVIAAQNSQCQIDYISFEAAPLDAKDAMRAHQAFPELAELSQSLIGQWPRRWHGVHRLSMLDGQVRVQLHYGQAETSLPRLSFAADIWFLDGFAPAKNPQLWSASFCHEIARHSRKGARLATFSVARAVREHLAEAGFDIEKAPGFGRKRDMLKAMYNKGFYRPMPAPAEQIAIIGGGIAGAAMAHALAKRHIPHFVLEQADRIASAASGNPSGLLVPFLSVGDMLAARLSISALADARAYTDRNGLITSSGVISLDYSERKAARQEKLARQDFPDDLARAIKAEEVAAMTGLDIGMGGLYHGAGGVVSPGAYCQSLIGTSPVHTHCQAVSVTGAARDWQIKCSDGQVFSASHIIYCGGAATPQLIGSSALPEAEFQITSGQLSYLASDSPLSDLKMAINYSGYLLPSHQDRQIIGAGFDHHQGLEVTIEGHQQNLDLMPDNLRPLAGEAENLSGRRALRLAVGDRLPVLGEIGQGQYLFTALGARGLTHAGFLAHSLACRIAGTADFLEQPLAAALLPDRLKER